MLPTACCPALSTALRPGAALMLPLTRGDSYHFLSDRVFLTSSDTSQSLIKDPSQVLNSLSGGWKILSVWVGSGVPDINHIRSITH